MCVKYRSQKLGDDIIIFYFLSVCLYVDVLRLYHTIELALLLKGCCLGDVGLFVIGCYVLCCLCSVSFHTCCVCVL